MLLADGVEHIARAGDVREINFGLDLVGRRAGRTAGFCLRVLTLL